MARISVKDAVHHAKEALAQLYEDDPPKALALEEIELITEDGTDLWAVTLGFYRQKSVSAIPGRGFDSLLGLGSLEPPQVENRVYKTVFINAATGEFVKMDMRQVQ